MLGQGPPQLRRHAFLGIDVAIERLLAEVQLATFIDHAVANLIGRSFKIDLRHD